MHEWVRRVRCENACTLEKRNRAREIDRRSVWLSKKRPTCEERRVRVIRVECDGVFRVSYGFSEMARLERRVRQSIRVFGGIAVRFEQSVDHVQERIERREMLVIGEHACDARATGARRGPRTIVVDDALHVGNE